MFDRALQTNFETAIIPQLQAGATTAREEAMNTAQVWGGTWSRKAAAAAGSSGGGIHWATYKACCRRHGAWKVDMNEVRSPWNSSFAHQLIQSTTADIR